MSSENKQTDSAEPNRPNLSVAFVLLPEFTLSTFSTFVDVLRLAGDSFDYSRQRLCRWAVLGPDLSPIKSSCGTRIMPDKIFDDPAKYDYLVICGGLVKGHDAIAPAVFNYIKQADQSACHIIGLCTGSFALALTGLLHSHTACIHWVHAPEFIVKYPDIQIDSSRLYLTSGKITTCSGGLASASLATNLVVNHCGLQQAHKVMNGLGIEVFREGQSPQQHKGADWFNLIENPSVRRAILLMESRINQTLTVEDIYQRLNISASTLERAFKNALDCSPAAFARMLRLAYGRWELLHTTKNITDIANDFGFSDSSHFSQWYKRVFGTTPREDRERAVAANGRVLLPVKPVCKLPPIVKRMLAGDLLLLDQNWFKSQKLPFH